MVEFSFMNKVVVGSTPVAVTKTFRTCFEQGVPWHSGNYRVRIHSEKHTGHDNNIE